MRAELADGRILEFPDGTDPAIVQATVKKVLARDKMIPGNEGVPDGTPKKSPGFGEKLIGQAETALSVGTGLFGGLAGNIAGIARGMHPDLIGTKQGAAQAQERASEIAQRFTYQPRTEAGQTNLQEMGKFIAESKLEGLGPTVPIMVPKVAKPRVKLSDILRVQEEQPKPKVPGVYTAQDAAAEGFTVTPRQARPKSTTAHLVEGISGSAKMEKGASVRNQPIANRLVAEDLGLDPKQPITVEALESIRKTEGQSYRAVKDSGVMMKATPEFKKSVSELGGDFKAATAELEGLVDMPKVDALVKSLSVDQMSANAAIEAVRYLRSQATRNLKGGALDPEKFALGTAQKKAADAIDEMIEANLSQAGKQDISDAYRSARVKIAKAHTAEEALNDATGNIDMAYLARLSEKKDLSGGMGKVAQFAKAFKGSARSVDDMKDATSFSLADVALGGGTQLATGNLLGLAAAGARPALRSLALSKLGQRMVIPTIEEARKMSPQTAQLKLIKLSELTSGKAANDPNLNALITVLSERAEQGKKK